MKINFFEPFQRIWSGVTHCQRAWPVAACLVSLATSSLAADVTFMAVVKGQRFTQDGPDLVALMDPDDQEYDQPLAMEAFAEGAAMDSLSAATLQPPVGPALPLIRENPDDTGLRDEYQTDGLLDLNTTRPNGSYTLNLATKNDGPRSITLNLTGDAYPVVPKATNFTALQTINPEENTTVHWSAMTGGTGTDFIQFAVYGDNDDRVFSTPDPGNPGALTGTAVQATIPADTLQPGRTYEAEILFLKVVDLNTSYSTAIAGYYKVVSFEINAVALPGTALGADMESSLPRNDSWDVARDSAVSFRFTHPMTPGFQSVSWTGLNPANFSYQWIDGNRLLLCQYSTPLPAGVEIGWTLNLAGFRDAANFPLVGTRNGSFNTSSEAPQSPPDVNGFYVLKMQGFHQTGASPVSTGMFGCDIGVELAAYNRVKEPATITLSGNGSSGRLEPDDWDAGLYFWGTYASKVDLDRFCPNGNFTFNISTLADGNKTLVLDLSGADDYPAAPVITNLAALQTVDPAAPTTITWNSLPGWSPTMTAGGGMLELEINSDQGNEMRWIDNAEFASAAAVTLPAGTFAPGRTYRLSLSFIRLKQLNGSYGDWGGASGFRTTTEFSIKTTGTPLMPGVTIARMGDAMSVTLSGGEPERSYVVETSSDLKRWLPQEQRWLNNAQDVQQYYDNDARYLSTRYYRLRDSLRDEMVMPHVAIQGTVWTNSARTQTVAGAVVGTSLDGRTTVTDAAGRFFLETDTPSNYGDGPYQIKVTGDSLTKDFGPSPWGNQPRQQNFEMQ